MRRTILFLPFLFCLAQTAAGQSASANHEGIPAPSSPTIQTPPAVRPSAAGEPQVIDGIAARIENGILTESQVRELERFQELVNGQAASREKCLQELIDQWIVRQEAKNTNFPAPAAEEVERAWEDLAKQFPSAQAFQARITQLGLSTAEVKDLLERQLYLTQFLDYKFHAAAQVSRQQIEAYYRNDLAPELRQRGLAVPSLQSVQAQIRELLTQREINERAAKWLDEARARLKIDFPTGGSGG